MTVQDVAEQLATSADHVRDLIHARRLPAINISRGSVKPRWRITAESLIAYLTARTSGSTPTRRRRRRREDDVIVYYS